MISLLLNLLRLLPFLFGGHRQLALENLALRHQLAVYKRTGTRPRLRGTDRLFWVALAAVWAGWKQSLVIVTQLRVQWPAVSSTLKIRQYRATRASLALAATQGPLVLDDFAPRPRGVA